ncbi:MAG: lipid II flippase MurJ, partial [Alphaproteobacteria bacterium]
MSLWRSSALVGFWTFLSRLLGFIRDLLLAMSFGSGPVADAFVAAFQIPNLCRRLFAEGAFNAAFVPVFTQQLQNFGKNSAKLFAENILVYLLGILLVVNIFAIMFMPEIVMVLAPGYSTQTIS